MSPALWNQYFPGEMPEGMTYQQFCAARAALWADEDREAALEQLDIFGQLAVHPDPEISQSAAQIHRRLLSEATDEL